MASCAWIPDDKWLTREMHKIKQVDTVQWLRDAIGQYQLVMNINRLHQTDSRPRAELFRLVVKEKHPLRGTWVLISENSNIDIMYNALMLKVISAINQRLQVMRSCELHCHHERGGSQEASDGCRGVDHGLRSAEESRGPAVFQ